MAPLLDYFTKNSPFKISPPAFSGDKPKTDIPNADLPYAAPDPNDFRILPGHAGWDPKKGFVNIGAGPEYEKAVNQANQRYTDYNSAMGSLKQNQAADVSEFNRSSPFVYRHLLGILNSRGLGKSYLSGGMGQGAMNDLEQNQALTLNNINDTYSGDMSQLKQQYEAGNQMANDFWTKYYTQQQQLNAAKQKLQASPLDYAGTVVGLGSTL